MFALSSSGPRRGSLGRSPGQLREPSVTVCIQQPRNYAVKHVTNMNDPAYMAEQTAMIYRKNWTKENIILTMTKL